MATLDREPEPNHDVLPVTDAPGDTFEALADASRGTPLVATV